MKVPGVDALREALAALSLDTRGHKAQLKKRLRTASKQCPSKTDEQQEEEAVVDAEDAEEGLARPASQDFDSYLVLDFEATCQRHELEHGHSFGFPNEIIEFPVVLLQWRRKPDARRRTISDSSDDSLSSASSASSTSTDSGESSSDQDAQAIKRVQSGALELVVVDEFRRFVRPTWRPKLSAFCTELTGITQADINAASTFTEVLEEFCFDFMHKHGLFTNSNRTIWVTDGPWDLRDFVAKQCYISGCKRPPWLSGPYIDIRSSATQYFSRGAPANVPLASPVPSSEAATGRSNAGEAALAPPTALIAPPSTRALGTANIPAVLDKLKLEPFQGRQHSGIDDVRNIARILQELVRPERAWRVTANARIKGRERSWEWMSTNGKVAWMHPPGE